MKKLLFITLISITFVPNIGFSSNFRQVATSGNIQITSEQNWQEVLTFSTDIPLFGNSTNCLVVASANIRRLDAADAVDKYRFVITVDDPNPNTGGNTERIVVLNEDVNVELPNTKPVATTLVFSNDSARTVRLLFRKLHNTNDAEIDDAHMSMLCTE